MNKYIVINICKSQNRTLPGVQKTFINLVNVKIGNKMISFNF